mmetsp:Transcript_62408/g.111185  ORF Transcript_62408/g.111185 Transcript_62408/m.111185 type:complete len:328 (-) Transcript_62408:700-1683(-)
MSSPDTLSYGAWSVLAGACLALGFVLGTAASPTSLWAPVATSTIQVQPYALLPRGAPATPVNAGRSPIVLHRPAHTQQVPTSGNVHAQAGGLLESTALGLMGVFMAGGAVLVAVLRRSQAPSYALLATAGEREPMHVSRRAMVPLVAGMALGVNAPATQAAAQPLDQCLYYILRVQEACLQEIRLVNSGLYKDVQRANVKLAVRMMIDNYKLPERFENAASYVKDSGKRAQAAQLGTAIVDSLYTILEYFDAGFVDNLAVGEELYGQKRTVVLGGLKDAADKIDDFVMFFPDADVQAVRDLIKTENDLNEKEFPQDMGKILNLAPKA